MAERGTHKSWLKSCPANDGNFKVHLKEASDEDIKEIIAELPEQGNKSKIATLKTELRKRAKRDRDTALAFCYASAAYERAKIELCERNENEQGTMESGV